MDLRLIKKLITLLEQSQLAELSVEQDGLSLSLKKNMTALPTLAPQPTMAAPQQAPAPTQALTPVGTEVHSPMIGTFYHASAPDKDPYVRPGDKVQKGDTIGIVEAMKMMNAIPSPVSGTVAKICTPNATGVEFGQVLMIIE